jgi:thioesterase domain-containing protein/acyl carrier protein
MLPSAFVVLDSLPLSPNGKVDHAQLPKPADHSADVMTEAARPRSSIEEALADIWKELLGLEFVGVHENFFDLGGHSLLAVQLIARIEKSLGKTVPVAALFKSPTISQLANLLGAENAEAWSSLIRIQTYGTRPPFFWIHGDSTNYLLPDLLGPDQPIYAFEHQGQDGKPAIYTEVDTIAEHYLNEVLVVRPHGPYFLGGYSFGAVLAYEIAQRLQSNGEEVPLLFMLDPPGRARETAAKPPMRLELRRHARELERFGTREALDYLLPRIKDLIYGRIHPIVRAFRKIRWKFHLAAGLILPATLRSAYILDLYWKAIHRYRPRPYSGAATIVRSKGGPYQPPLEWPKLITGGLEIYEGFGGHMDLKEGSYVKQWAEHLWKSLDHAHQSSASGKL